MIRHWLGCAVAALAFVAAPVSAQVCEALPATTLADFVAANKMLTLNAIGTTKKAWDAYFAAPDDQKLEALMFEIGMGAAGMSVPGLGTLIKAGRVYVKGAEWTVAEAEKLQIDAFLCGGASGGDRLPAIGFFDLKAAQQLSPGISCGNFMDRITSLEQFQRFEDLFKGYYSRTMLELGGRQNRESYQAILDKQWEVVSRTWQARTGARLVAELRNKLIALANGPRTQQCTPTGAVAGPHFALKNTTPRPNSVPSDWAISLTPGVITFKAAFGESTCKWSGIPDNVGLEGFTLNLTVTAKSEKRTNIAANIEARSGFSKVNFGDPTSAELFVQDGDGDSKTIALPLKPLTFDFLHPGDLVYLQVGGCNAGGVDYVYEFRDK